MRNQSDCVYRKVGRRYTPIGVCEPIDYLPNGIWYIRTKPSVKSRTNCEYVGELLKIGDAEDISMNIQCGLHNLVDEILDSKEINEVLNAKKGYSINELIHVVCKIMWDKYGTKQMDSL